MTSSIFQDISRGYTSIKKVRAKKHSHSSSLTLCKVVGILRCYNGFARRSGIGGEEVVV